MPRAAFSTSLLLLAACAAPAAAAGLDDTERNALLDPMVTAPTKRAQSARSVPGTVAVLSAQEIRDRGYVDLVDAVRDLAGVTVADHQLAEYGASRITVRGIAGNQQLAFLLNGRRALFASRPQGDAPYFLRTLPLAAVKRIELMYGPGSALYGADAVSGVLNVVTHDGADAPGTRVDTSYGLAGTANAVVMHGAELDEGVSLFALGRLARSDGEDLARHPRYAAAAADRAYWPGSATRDASQRTDCELVSYRHLGLAVDVLRTGFDGASVPVGVDSRYAGNALARWRMATQTVAMEYAGAVGPVHAATTLTYDQISLDPTSSYVFNPLDDPAAATPAERAAFVTGHKWGQGRVARLEQTLVREIDEDLHLLAGIVAEDHNGVPKTGDLAAPVDPLRSITALGFAPHEINWAQYQNYGAYGQVQLGYVPGLQTTLGLRYDYNTRYEPVLNPRVGMVYALGDATTLKASWATSYLAPSLGQSYLTWGTPGTYMGFPNPALRPVRGQTAELSVQQALGPGGLVSLAAFRTALTDLIHEHDAAPRVVAGQLTPGTIYVNGDAAVVHGVDARLDAGLPGGHQAFGSLGLLDGAIAEATGEVQGLPEYVRARAFGGVTLRLAPGLVLTPRLTWLSGATTGQRGTDPSGRDLAGSFLLDLGGRAEVAPGWALTLAGSNLLDQVWETSGEHQVFTLGNAVVQPGRRASLGVSHTF